MTSALAAQGGVTASAALYAGTALFDTILCSLLTQLLIPAVYIYLTLSVACSATGEALLKKLSGFVKWLSVWILKTVLYVFTGYMGITGVVSGTTDAATLKAAKITISGVVPVVGGILSDASETVLVSAGLMKNSAGVYGILACLSVFLGPFLRIAVHYWVLKITAVLCGVLSEGAVSSLAEDFSAAMGLLLAMTASVCVLLLVSTVCFMKGVA
jgi:stage III sporulation protein AE